MASSKKRCLHCEYHCDAFLDIAKTPLKSQIIVRIDTVSSIKASIMTRAPRDHGSLPNRGIRCQKSTGSDVANQLQGVKSREEAASILANALMQRLSNALAVPMENLDSSWQMHVYGVDSLITIEIRSWLNQKPKAKVAIFEILGEVTIRDIGLLVAGESEFMETILKGAEKPAKSSMMML